MSLSGRGGNDLRDLGHFRGRAAGGSTVSDVASVAGAAANSGTTTAATVSGSSGTPPRSGEHLGIPQEIEVERIHGRRTNAGRIVGRRIHAEQLSIGRGMRRAVDRQIGGRRRGRPGWRGRSRRCRLRLQKRQVVGRRGFFGRHLPRHCLEKVERIRSASGRAAVAAPAETSFTANSPGRLGNACGLRGRSCREWKRVLQCGHFTVCGMASPRAEGERSNPV